MTAIITIATIVPTFDPCGSAFWLSWRRCDAVAVSLTGLGVNVDVFVVELIYIYEASVNMNKA